MVNSKLLFEYQDERLSIINNLLDSLLLSLSKYATSPVCVMQFLISRINLKPDIVLSSYNDKNIITQASKANNYLNLSMMDADSDSTNPTVIVFQSSLNSNDIIFNAGEDYYYSSAYLIGIKGMREAIKEKGIKRFAVYTNNDRSSVSCNLEISKPVEIMRLPEFPAVAIKLPFRNILKANPQYAGIIKEIMEGRAVPLSKEEIDALFESVKKEQIAAYEDIKILKDFMKQKPLAMKIYQSKSIFKGDSISTVSLNMEFNNKLTHILFYRYIDGIVDKVLGDIKEVKDG
jgi:hypothetical protein